MVTTLSKRQNTSYSDKRQYMGLQECAPLQVFLRKWRSPYSDLGLHTSNISLLTSPAVISFSSANHLLS